MKLYFCHTIRGSMGEEATEAYQRANIQMAVAKAQVLIDHFPSIEWVVPHANEIVNEMYFLGLVTGQDILDAECKLIREEYDGIVVVGDYYGSKGVCQEIHAADDSDKFIWFMEDVMESDREELATAIQEWNDGSD